VTFDEGASLTTTRLVEAVSDQSLEIYFRENIFAPLCMKDVSLWR
jgi:CubicO group peptidase (beta-lactamase class C family)